MTVFFLLHYKQDIVGGLLISISILAVMTPFMHFIDWLILTSEYTAVVAISTVIFLLCIYPIDPKQWSMDRGDTAAILGSGLGVILGFNFHGPYPDDLEEKIIFNVPTLMIVWMSLLRFVVGILLLLPTRFVMKLLCFKLLPAIMPTHGVEEVVKRPLVELPYKIITYGAIGFNAAYTVQVVFHICGISRFEDGIAF